MTSALRGREGGWSKRDDSTDRLREWDSDKGGRGSKNPKTCGRHLSIAPNQECLILDSTKKYQIWHRHLNYNRY